MMLSYSLDVSTVVLVSTKILKYTYERVNCQQYNCIIHTVVNDIISNEIPYVAMTVLEFSYVYLGW